MCPASSLAHVNPPNPRSTANDDIVPSSEVSKAAYELASALLPPAILNHSVRVYLLAVKLAERSDSMYVRDQTKRDLLFAACILHDVGTTEQCNGPLRFEVEGADAASKLLREHGISAEEAHQVWMAITLHTSPHIAERINELCCLVRMAVLLDFGKGLDKLEDAADYRISIEQKFDRMGIEKVLGDAVVQQAVKNPEKAPAASWPNNLYKTYLQDPNNQGVNEGF
ncbi:hypothetical protein M011DRAFT_412962 [Sporormia fimetaria CBS 119925]|uniref:HD/PDEase domain-containing protein n=1 Tax=Sporormia fimetaria CBS 119925 TaxID=1340428 RepID=A0A6A6UWJ5_9PLEO|nr:hypothetical protein M011DRAFT_412962 [Sporormia fimetaria CBS 119925]